MVTGLLEDYQSIVTLSMAHSLIQDLKKNLPGNEDKASKMSLENIGKGL